MSVRRHSLSRSLLWPLALVVLASGSLLAFALHQSIDAHFTEMDAADLHSFAEQYLQHHPAPSPSVHQHPGSLATIETANSHHQRLAALRVGTDPLPAELAALQHLPAVNAINAANLTDWQNAGIGYRGAVFQTPNGQQVAVAMTTEFHQQYLQRLYWQVFLSIAACVLLVLTTGWFSIRRGLQPLARLSRQIAAIHTGQLDQRIDASDLPQELHGLVQSFNLMVSRLQQSFARLSEFSADIAHELRTPLSNMLTQTEVSLSKARTIEQYQDLLYSNLEELARLSKMVSDMLWLAKTDHGLIAIAAQPVAMRGMCRGLLEFFDVLAQERQLSLQLEGPELTVNGDAAMLQRALSNLLSNAVRYACAGSVVRCQLALVQTPAGPQVTVAVSNHGDTITPEQQQKIFARFYRADPSRQRQAQDGAGLGLALVQSIMQLHGGSVSVQSAGQLTCFTLHLPLTALDINAGQSAVSTLG